jgi:broad specificity phosphatase PhoE
MKYLLPLLLIVLLAACNSTKIYVVRHAEKGSTGADPSLTAEGKQRAEALKDLLHKDSLMGAFATQFERTFQTAEPTAIDQRITLRRYQANAGNALLDSLSHIQKKKYLVVGHSNTVLTMLQSIGLHPSMSEIPETDYDNLFVVTVRWFLGRHVQLQETTYGKATQ